MINSLLSHIKSRPELIILAMMVLVIVMLIITLPTYLIDFLIGLNLTMAILIFMGSFYISRILDFSSFPSILLVTTLFRLAISISTSRLVLMDADAGEIVASFGQFVIGDNLVVGFVIFSLSPWCNLSSSLKVRNVLLKWRRVSLWTPCRANR